ncbi:hypothetical protein [Amycolatopsis nigrescens]|uniref:hypothetical protein n=1 Tax=Amycolatopsis nigrescens TaxID=381445 RepID=UPI0004758279|nr:hypothetical protein [Amycolatopsis nigrescens]
MGDTGGDRTRPEALRVGAGNVGGIILHGVNAVADLERLALAPASLAGLGRAVAGANGTLQGGQVTALRSLLSLLQQVNDQVRRTADAAQAVAGQEGSPVSTDPATIWGTPVAAELAAHAVADNVDGVGDPRSVHNILGYMRELGLGAHPIDGARFSGVADFNDWLAGNADNQAQIGVIEVYSGPARALGEIPGGTLGGDVVVIEPYPSFGHDALIGISGGDGRLYNHGRVDSAIRGVATVSVYRPAATGSGHPR